MRFDQLSFYSAPGGFVAVSIKVVLTYRNRNPCSIVIERCQDEKQLAHPHMFHPTPPAKATLHDHV